MNSFNNFKNYLLIPLLTIVVWLVMTTPAITQSFEIEADENDLALEVKGYTKLGSGDAFPALKVKSIEVISIDQSSVHVNHDLSNGYKISQIFARAALYSEDSNTWDYFQLPIIRWDDEIIRVSLTPVTDFGFPREGQLIKVLVIYEDQGLGVD